MFHLMQYAVLLVTLRIRFRRISRWSSHPPRPPLDVPVSARDRRRSWPEPASLALCSSRQEVHDEVGAVGRTAFLHGGTRRRFRSVGFPGGREL